MNVIVTGAGGFVGSKLVHGLLKNDRIERITAFDVTFPKLEFLNDKKINLISGDLSDKKTIENLITSDTDSIFHLAALLSGDAENQFEQGIKVNIGGTMNMLDVCSKLSVVPNFIFSSSIAAYGGNLPDVVTDDTLYCPETSYGMEKVCCQYLINDYSRRKKIHGLSVILPFVGIRPEYSKRVGQWWMSAVIRDVLNGKETICPVTRDSIIVITSVSRLVNNLILVNNQLSNVNLGVSRTILAPSLSVSINDIIEALNKIVGKNISHLIKFKQDQKIQNIIDFWPKEMTSKRAQKTGMVSDENMESIIRSFIEDNNIKIS